MNLTYRLIRDAVTDGYVPATAFARNGKIEWRIVRIAYLSTLPLFTPAAYAAPAATELPGGGQVTAGSASIDVDGSHMDVNQASQNASIDWQTFNIGQNAQVDFHQPNASAVAVNRIADPNGSQIMGRLNANGQIYLINPNGVLFGQGSQVNVGGLVASTLNISDADAASGKRTFSSTANGGEGKIVNQGTITAADGGYVALLGGQVSNQGIIQARLGTVALAAGDKISLDFAGDKLLNVEVDKGALQALVENKQLIQADGGIVLMTAKAADALLSTAVNNEGVIEAHTVEGHNGVIKLLGDMDSGTVNVGGTLDASAPLPSPSGRGGEESNGGFIETSAAHVRIADDAKITTKAENGQSGTWLIDPVDFTIASGSGALTTSGIGASTLSTALGGSNVAIATNALTGGNGDIFVNSAVSWSANKLTLTAHRNIAINANLNGSGTAQLALEYGQGALAAGNTSNYTLNNGAKVSLPAGANFSTKLGSDGAPTIWTVITALGAENSTTGTDLQGMFGTVAITPANLAGNYVLGADINAGPTSGWAGGFNPVGYYRISDGNSKVFTGKFDGLGHTISNLSINRTDGSFGLFGWTQNALLQNVGLLNVAISGGSNGATGALVGRADTGTTIRNSYVDGGSVYSSTQIVGGLVGVTLGSSAISYSYANVSVSAGLGGGSTSAMAGGLVGINNGAISYSYATGSVSAPSGNAAASYIGGLVGRHQNTASISNSYATGLVTGNNTLGGLVGFIQGVPTITSSYWDETTTGQNSSAGGGTGLTTAQWLTNGPFSSSPSDGAWSTADWGAGNPYPGIKALPYITITASASQTYGSAASFGISSILDQTGANASGLVNTGSLAWTASTSAASAAGTTSAVRGAGATGTGYQILYAGNLTVAQAPLTLTANGFSKTYDSLAYSGGNGVTYSGFVNGETSAVLGGTLAYGGSSQNAVNAGSYAITPSGLTSSNYAITFADGSLTVNPAALTVTANNAAKIYDGLAYSGGNGVGYSGFVNSEGSGVLGGALAYGGSAQDAINAGTYAIAPSGLTASNYAITFANGSLTVNPAALTITANGFSKIYDGLAYSGGNGVGYSGLVNGEGVGVLGGSLGYGGSAQGAVNAGSYAITPSGLTSSNYAITFADGTLTVTPAALTVTANAAPTLIPNRPPEQVLNVMAQLESTILSPPISSQPVTSSLSPAMTVAQNPSAEAVEASSPESVTNAVQTNTKPSSTTAIGANGPTFTIVHPGVNLPDYMLNVNE